MPRQAVAAQATALAMQEYVKGMERFLEVEQQVMETFLHRLRPAGGDAVAPAPSTPTFPLLGKITSLAPGQELTAVRQLSQEDDRFLQEHALGGPVSLTDAALRPLIVVPLTMSMEILAEAAAALMPGKVVIGMRDIQAHHWIKVDDVPVTLQISARRMVNAPHEVEVQVRDLGDVAGQDTVSTLPAIRGILVLGDEYPAPPPVSTFSLTAERASRLASTELYDGRLMFHGPCFQGVTGVHRSASDGLVGQLQVLPRGNLFRSNPDPRFVTDPVVLDAAGQLVGFWAAEHLEHGSVVFPYRLDALHIYGPNRPAGEHLTCRVKLQLLGNERIRSDLEILGADGSVWMQLHGWEDRRFDPPKRFHHAWIAPGEALISEPWLTPLSRFPGQDAFECCRLEPLFEPGNTPVERPLGFPRAQPAGAESLPGAPRAGKSPDRMAERQDCRQGCPARVSQKASPTGASSRGHRNHAGRARQPDARGAVGVRAGRRSALVADAFERSGGGHRRRGRRVPASRH